MVTRPRRHGSWQSLALWLAALAMGCSATPIDDGPTNTASPTPAVTVAATASTIPAGSLQVSGESVVEVPDARIIGPSPGGEYLASWSSVDGLCVHQIPALEEVSCSSFEPDDPSRHVDPRSIAWSPDASRIAFHEELFLRGEDSDIWTLDVLNGMRTNLTDDGVSGSVIGAGEGAFLDVAPAWSPDGTRIAFGRAPSTLTGSEIDVIAADGSGPPSQLASEEHVVYYGTRWSADGATLVYVLRAREPTDPLNGIYTVSAAGGTSRQVLGLYPELGRPALLGVSPDARVALVVNEDALASRGAEGDFYDVLQLEDGTLEAVREPAADDADPTFVVSAALSPDGTKVAYAYRSGTSSRLAVRDIAGGAEHVLVERSDPGPFGLAGGVTGIAWPTDEVLYVPLTRSSGIVYQLGVSVP